MKKVIMVDNDNHIDHIIAKRGTGFPITSGYRSAAQQQAIEDKRRNTIEEYEFCLDFVADQTTIMCMGNYERRQHMEYSCQQLLIALGTLKFWEDAPLMASQVIRWDSTETAPLKFYSSNGNLQKMMSAYIGLKHNWESTMGVRQIMGCIVAKLNNHLIHTTSETKELVLHHLCDELFELDEARIATHSHTVERAVGRGYF